MCYQKIVFFLMTFLLLLATGCASEGNIANKHMEAEPVNEVDVVYRTISPDWPIYKSADELIEICDEVILGRVTNISFQVLDIRTGKIPEAEAEELYCYLYTIYDISDVQSNGLKQEGRITVQEIISSFGITKWRKFESIAKEIAEIQ